jgi:hypothetical protein
MVKMNKRHNETIEQIMAIPEFKILEKPNLEDSGTVSERDLDRLEGYFSFEKYLLFRGTFTSLDVELNESFKKEYFASFNKFSLYKKLFSSKISSFNDMIIIGNQIHNLLKDATGLEFLVTNSYIGSWLWICGGTGDRRKYGNNLFERKNYSSSKEENYDKKISFDEMFRCLSLEEQENFYCGFKQKKDYIYVYNDTRVKIFDITKERRREIDKSPHHLSHIEERSGLPDKNILYAIKATDRGKVTVNYTYDNNSDKCITIPIREYILLNFKLEKDAILR